MKDFMSILRIYKYMEVDKAWYLHSGMGTKPCFFGNICNGHNFRGVSETIVLDKVVCKYCHNKNNFNTM